MKTRKRNKQGISLIVLVITIIVMIILAAAIILSLTSSGIINRANEAVNQSNLAQVKTLAQTIWSEVYLENLDKPQNQKLDYQTEVINRLTEQKIDISKFDISADESGVDVTQKPEGKWITLYENNLPTTNYMLQVSDTNIFTSNARYKITIEGLGEVETTAVYMGIENGMQTFGLFGIDNGKLIGIENAEDAEEKMQAAGKEAIIVAGAFLVENSLSGLIFNNATTEYTVTKIEMFVIERFKGNFALTGSSQQFEKLNVEKSYYIVYDYEEQEYSAATVAMFGPNMIQNTWGYATIEIRNGSITGREGINIKEVYELCDNGTLYSEAGFTVTAGGTLVGTPDTECIIPYQIKGHIVTSLWQDYMSGIPVFERPIEIGKWDVYWTVSKIIVTTTDISFLNYETNGLEEIDLSGCSSDLVLSEYLLTDTYVVNDIKIYVSEEVKANYPQEHIVAK